MTHTSEGLRNTHGDAIILESGT